MSTTTASPFAAYARSRSSVFTKLDPETRARLNEAIVDRTYGSHRATYDHFKLQDKLSFTAFYLYARNILLISAAGEQAALHHHAGRPEQSAAQFLLARLAEAAVEPDTSSKVIQRLAEAWSCAERMSLNQRRFVFQQEQAAQRVRDREADRAERAEARAQRAKQREADRAERARQREADRAERAQARAQARAERIEARIQARAERIQARAQRTAQRAEDRAERARRAAESRAFCECPLDYTAPTPEERSAATLDAYDDAHNVDVHIVDEHNADAHNADAHDDAAEAERQLKQILARAHLFDDAEGPPSSKKESQAQRGELETGNSKPETHSGIIDRDPELYAGPKPYEQWELDADGRPLSPEAIAAYLKDHPEIMKGVPHHTTYMFDNIPPDGVPLIEGMEIRRQQFRQRQKAAGLPDTTDNATALRAHEARAEQQLKEILAGADIPDEDEASPSPEKQSQAQRAELETGNAILETHSPPEAPSRRYEPFLPKPSNPWYDAW